MTTENGKLLFIFTIRVVFVCSRRFEKAFWQASEADIQDYAHARTSSLGFFSHYTYYYYNEADVRTAGPCSVVLV